MYGGVNNKTSTAHHAKLDRETEELKHKVHFLHYKSISRYKSTKRSIWKLQWCAASPDDANSDGSGISNDFF